MDIEEALKKVDEYQKAHTIMGYEECLAWVAAEKNRGKGQAARGKEDTEAGKVGMEEFLEEGVEPLVGDREAAPGETTTGSQPRPIGARKSVSQPSGGVINSRCAYDCRDCEDYDICDL